MNKFASIILFSLLLISCQDKIIQPTEKYQMFDYYVDAYGNEGIVIEDSINKGILYFVISADETFLPWGSKDIQVNPELYIDYTYGFPLKMLQRMIFLGIENFPAQAWCNAKNHGTKLNVSSWRLSSADEITYFRKNKFKLDSLNEALLSIGGTPLDTSELYWTCYEDCPSKMKTYKNYYMTYDPSHRAMAYTPLGTWSAIKINGNVDKAIWSKNNTHKVRAVKYIYANQ